MWVPSVFLTNPRIWGRAVDNAAWLVAPFGDWEDSLLVIFELVVRLIRHMDSMRHREATGNAKSLAQFEAQERDMFCAVKVPPQGSVTRQDKATPRLTLKVEESVFNADVEEYVKARNPRSQPSVGRATELQPAPLSAHGDDTTGRCRE